MNNGAQTFIVITMIIIFIIVIIYIYHHNKAIEYIMPYVTFCVRQEDEYYRYYDLPREHIPMLEKISGNLYIFYGNGIRKIKLTDDARMDSFYNELKWTGSGTLTAAVDDDEAKFVKQFRHDYSNKTEEYRYCKYFIEMNH